MPFLSQRIFVVFTYCDLFPRNDIYLSLFLLFHDEDCYLATREIYKYIFTFSTLLALLKFENKVG